MGWDLLLFLLLHSRRNIPSGQPTWATKGGEIGIQKNRRFLCRQDIRLCQRPRIGRISREEMTSTYRRHPMAEATLEERVATLEQLVAQLMHTSERTTRKKDWRRTIGMFDGDPIMQEIMVEGQRLREEDRRQGGG